MKDVLILTGLFAVACAAHSLGKWLGGRVARRLFGQPRDWKPEVGK